MLANMEPKPCTPSVIAKLMGLDELPPQQPVQKRQRVLSENYLQRVASIGVLEKLPFYERPSFRVRAEEHKGIKYAFEVSETGKRGMHYNLSVKEGKALSSPSDTETTPSGDFINSRCISIDVKLKTSKELDCGMGATDSEEDCLLSSDLVYVPIQPQSMQRTVFSSISAFDCRKIGVCKKCGERGCQENAKPFKKVENGLVTDSGGASGLDNSHGILKCQFESTDEERLPHTRNTVLQPNHRKSRNSTFCVSSPSFPEVPQSGWRRKLLQPENENISVQVKEKKILASKVTPFGLVLPPSPGFSYWRNKYKSSFYYSVGSYVEREAKKQIMERWKMTKKFQEVGVAHRGRTLSEMLATPDQELRPRILGFKCREHGLSNCICPEFGGMNLHVPFAVCRQDHLKDEGTRYLPMPRSPIGYPNAIGTPKPRSNHKATHNKRYMGPIRHMSRMRVACQKDGLRRSVSSCMKSQTMPGLETQSVVGNNGDMENELTMKLEEEYPCKHIPMVSNSSNCSCSVSVSENNYAIQESWVIAKQKNNINKKDLTEQSYAFPFHLVSNVATVGTVTNGLTDVEAEAVGRNLGNHKDQQFETTDSIWAGADDDSSQISDNLIQQDILAGNSEVGSVSSFCCSTDTESLPNLEEGKEGYHPSPVSVLEPLLKEDFSSGLPRQVDFMKLEFSETYSEGSGMIVSSDEETEEGSEGNSEEIEDKMRLHKVEESRDFSYIVDVLHEAGFHGRSPDIGFETWHSPEYAINPLLFEKLEKKYGEQMCWKRSERRWLFDCINLGLMDILQPPLGLYTWAKPVSRRLSFRQSLEEELWALLGSLEKKVSTYVPDQKVLGKDDKWLELGDDIEAIGREIESSLIDELATEVVVSMESI